MEYKDKYIKYKSKYLELIGGKKLKKNKLNYTNKINMEIKYREQHLSEPWFSLISLGLKTVEGRKNKNIFKEM
jgi:hypothetical protein